MKCEICDREVKRLRWNDERELVCKDCYEKDFEDGW